MPALLVPTSTHARSTVTSPDLPSTMVVGSKLFVEPSRLEPSPVSETSSGTGAGFFVAKSGGAATSSEDARRLRQDLRTWLRGHPAILEQLNDMVTKLKRREETDQHALAKKTAVFLRNMIGTCRASSVGMMLQHVRAVGIELEAANRLHVEVGNIVRRTLHIMRQKGSQHGTKPKLEAFGGGGAMEDRLSSVIDPLDVQAPFSLSKQAVLEGLNSLLAELEDHITPIVKQAVDHIHASEVILTYDHDILVEEFLRAAAKRRKFEVFIAESAPRFTGHDMARRLATGTDPIVVTVIGDAAIYAIMARVHKVIIGTRSVMANGGLVAPSGAHLIALAAKDHAVPVVCVTALFKLCPMYAHDVDDFNEILSPTDVLAYDELPTDASGVDVVNPAFDYVPPELVSLFITNARGLQPSYVYRILAEYFSPEDLNL